MPGDRRDTGSPRGMKEQGERMEQLVGMQQANVCAPLLQQLV